MRKRCVEPSADDRLDTMVAEAPRTAEQSWFAAISVRLGADGRARGPKLVAWREHDQDR